MNTLPVFVPPTDIAYPERSFAALAQYRRGELHEDDFAALRGRLGPGDVAYDVGANIGNSLASLALVCPGMTVVAFEPNPGLARTLQHCALQLPLETDVRSIGLGDSDCVADLFIPVVDGMHIIGEASLLLAHFEDEIVAQRLAGYGRTRRFSLIRTQIELCRLDSLTGLPAPGFIKIDIEGAEGLAIDGMVRTLAEHCPVLMIESDRTGAIDARLEPLGYRAYAYLPSSGCLAPRSGYRPLNTFYLNADRHDGWTRPVAQPE